LPSRVSPVALLFGFVTLSSDARWSTAVCVPVRNEEALLPIFLDAMAAQAGAPDVVLCVLLDACIDDSEAILEARRSVVPFEIAIGRSEAAAPNAGRARRAAMALAETRLAGGQSVIISTDADSVPEPAWLDANRAALGQADVAAGRIVRVGGEPSPLQDRVEAYYDALAVVRRLIDPVPWEAELPHHYTSAASLAFRLGDYISLGGFEPVPSAEDARLVDAAHRAGLRVRRDSAIRVQTSSRREGRARNGLADHLRRLDAASDDTASSMAHPDDMVWRYAGHAAARLAWPARDRIVALAASLGIPPEDVRHIAAGSPNAEAFAMRVVPDVPGGQRIVPLAEAERALARLLQDGWKPAS